MKIQLENTEKFYEWIFETVNEISFMGAHPRNDQIKSSASQKETNFNLTDPIHTYFLIFLCKNKLETVPEFT